MSENLKRHRPDIKVLVEGRAIAFMPEDTMGVWVHIQEVRDLLDVKDKENAELKAENKRLKDELDAANNQCENLINSATDIMLRQDKVNDAKCDEIESLKASHYAEMVDAGMRERRLRRALYKALANWAKSERYTEATWHGDERREELWAKVQDKCLKKMEEYR